MPYPVLRAIAANKSQDWNQRKLTEWRRSEAGQIALQNYRSFGASVAGDGSFQMSAIFGCQPTGQPVNPSIAKI
jgi:hypothetical protein